MYAGRVDLIEAGAHVRSNCLTPQGAQVTCVGTYTGAADAQGMSYQVGSLPYPRLRHDAAAIAPD